MALYDKLLLSKGGGIIPMQHLVEQNPNTATLLIGLGGTGIDCISLIKEKVEQRVFPDDPLDAEPTYKHIRFLGVDINNENSRLNNSEFFSIACNTSIAARFNNRHINKIPYLSWLDRERIAPLLADIANSGHGNRQVGRFLMMDKSADFIERLSHEINLALEKLGNQFGQPALNIHIISGISGSVSSGSFLDVCYMVKYVTKKLYANVTIYGDFFLPDVSLLRISNSNLPIRDNICINGYAAMQELDYCMRLPKNGGSFTQEYQGHHQINWDSTPVDVCNLIGSTDSTHRNLYGAYHHALNVTSEYVMTLLTQPDLGLMTNISAQRDQTKAGKTAGAEFCYFALGAASISVPAKEILTYLSAQLFACFKSVLKTTAGKEDSDNLAKDLFKINDLSISVILSSLVKNLQNELPQDFEIYHEDWKYVRDYGNSGLVEHYTNQAAMRIGVLERNGKQLLESLETSAYEILTRISSDINAGPLYLSQLLSQHGTAPSLSIIDSLIQENNSHLATEQAQSALRFIDFDSAKSDFDNHYRRSLVDTDEKRFHDYEFALMCLESHKVSVRTYELLDNILKEFRGELYNLSESVFLPLGEITESLIESFDSNSYYLNNRIFNNPDSISLLDLDQIKPELDFSINEMDITSVFKGLVAHLLEGIQDISTNTTVFKISAIINVPDLVCEYFTDIFESVTSQYTIDSLLRKRYPNYDNEQLSDAIYRDIFKKLDNLSAPLYPCNSFGGHTSDIKLLTYPKSSTCNAIAANRMHMIDPRFMLNEGYISCQNTSENHISCICIQCGLPMYSYDFASEYEHIYYNTATKPGCHLYMGMPEKNMQFSDWNKLPSVIPFSLTDKKSINHSLAEKYNASAELFMNAYSSGIIDITGQIYDLSENSISKLLSLCDEAGSLMFKAKRAQDVYHLENIADSIRTCISSMMTESSISFEGGDSMHDEETRIRVLMDYFISSPAIHDHVSSQVVLSNQAKVVKERAASILDGLDITIGHLKSDAITETKVIWEGATGYNNWDKDEETDFIYDIPIADMSEKYIFISYAHKDSDIVLPILKRMSQNGYVIWYDNHIAAASEWDDSIAEHIENSSYVISFISRNYMDSENCMDELKYARDEKKKPLLVFLEDLSLRGGLAMRLNRLQHIHHFKFNNDEMFFRKLYEAEGINICHKK